MEAAMATYRCFFLDPQSHARDRIELNALDDGDAVRAAMRLLADNPIEIWRDTTLIGTLRPSLASHPACKLG